MTLSDFENKVMDYLIKRKTAATIKQIAKFMIRSDSHVTSTMKGLVEKGLVDVIVAGSTKFYTVKQ